MLEFTPPAGGRVRVLLLAPDVPRHHDGARMRWASAAVIAVFAGAASARPTPDAGLPRPGGARSHGHCRTRRGYGPGVAGAVRCNGPDPRGRGHGEQPPSQALRAGRERPRRPASRASSTPTPVLPSATPSCRPCSRARPSVRSGCHDRCHAGVGCRRLSWWGGLCRDERHDHCAVRAPPRTGRDWFQGSCWVVDEATGTIYNDIPVMP